MKKVELNKDGELSSKDLKFFGGSFSFFEKLGMSGIGSPKIIYESGINEFDSQKRNVEGELGFVNFELLKNGLILRLNLNQRFSGVGIRLSDIIELKLVSYSIETEINVFDDNRYQVNHWGELEIISKKGILKFRVLADSFDGIVKFFLKKGLTDKFSFLEIDKSPETEQKFLEDLAKKFNKLDGDEFV